MIYDGLLFLHVLGAMVLFGTGAGIAFFMLLSHRSDDPTLIAHVSGIVVVADTVFTATAALLQPITGIMLARLQGWSLLEGWVALSLGLYVFVGLFWLPVVWMQLRMRGLARRARDENTNLSDNYYTLFRLWFIFGLPAFAAMLVIIWLMLHKPEIPWLL